MNKISKNLFIDTFIVAPSATKKFFLNIKNTNLEYNFKFITKEELQQYTYGNIDQDKAILFLMQKENLSFLIAKKIVNYLRRGAKNKIKQIDFDKYRLALSKEGFIKISDAFQHLIKDKTVIFISYSKNNLEIRNLIKTLKLNNVQFIQFADFFEKNSAKTIYKFENIEEEVKHALNLISRDLELNKQIKIICSKDSYSYYLNLFGDSIGIKFNYLDNDSLFNTEFGKELFNLIKKDTNISLMKYIKKHEKALLLKYGEQVQLIQKVLSRFNIDYLPKQNKIMNLKEILKSYSAPNLRYEKAPIVSSSLDFDENYEYYFLNVIEGNFPSLSVNSDILDDKDKEIINIETSDQYNEMIVDLSTAFIRFKNLKFLSYYLVDNNVINEPSFFVLNGNKTIEPSNLGYDYSETIASNFYKSYKHQYKKYGDVVEDLKHYETTFRASNFKFKDYDPYFKEISFVDNSKLNYSYSTISKYYKCPFKFYCERVLKLNPYVEDSFYIKYGKVAHRILEHVFDKDVDYEALYDEYKKTEKFSKKDSFFLDSLKDRLKYAFYGIRKRIEKQTFDKKPEVEENLVYKINQDITIEGVLDSIVFLKSKNSSKKYMYVVDYKTGNPPKYEPEKLKDGHVDSIQLSTYLFLLQKSTKYKNYESIGFYIQPLKFKYIDVVKNRVKLHLRGITLDEQDVYVSMDSSITTAMPQGSGILHYKSGKNKGIEYSYSKNKFKEIGNDYEALLNDFHTKYKSGNFVIESTGDTCKECEFSNVCYLKNRAKKK